MRPGVVRREVRDAARPTASSRCTPQDLAGGDAAHNAARLRACSTGDDRGPHRDALVLSAALALEVAGRGRRRAREAVRAAATPSTAAMRARLLERLAAFGRRSLTLSAVTNRCTMSCSPTWPLAAAQRVEAARERVPEAALRAAALGTPPPPPLKLAPHGFDLIAELKLRSPVGRRPVGERRSIRCARLAAYARGRRRRLLDPHRAEPLRRRPRAPARSRRETLQPLRRAGDAQGLPGRSVPGARGAGRGRRRRAADRAHAAARPSWSR